jgi:hypothetical protein
METHTQLMHQVARGHHEERLARSLAAYGTREALQGTPAQALRTRRESARRALLAVLRGSARPEPAVPPGASAPPRLGT